MRNFVFLFLLFSAVLGWAELIIPTGSSHGICGSCNYQSPGCWADGCGCLGSCNYNNTALSSYINAGYTCVGEWVGNPGYCGESTCGLNTSGNFGAFWTGYCYKNESNPDSVYCVQQGKFWVNGECVEEHCNDHINVPDKCMETWKNGYSTDADGNPGGGGYWAITTYECFYDSCAMSLNCTEKSSFPAGNLTCDDFQDTTSNNNCVAVIGSQCTIQCGNNVTINCNCDGSCSHASTRLDCNCPQSSSSQNSSSSSEEQSNSSSSQSQNSSDSGPNSSNSPVDTTGNGDWEYNYSGVLNEIEYNTRQTATYTNIASGYLSSIDRWQSTINFNIQSESNKIQGSIESGATQVANAVNGAKDSIHNTNEILSDIRGSVAGLDDSVDVPDISGWLDSASGTLESLKNPDTTYIRIDSLKSDTSQFKSKYSSMFLTGVYTRNGCYEFKISKPSQNSLFGRVFSSDISVNFGNLAGFFDLCAILRGICRIAGAILVLLISIKSYRSAFSSSDG